MVHNSNLVHLENNGALDDICWYTSDTQRGSSGSPVFNNRWEIVAVHHRSIPKRNNDRSYIDIAGRRMTEEEYRVNSERAIYVANEGSRTSRIVRTLRTATFDDPAQAAMRDALLDLWEGSRLINQGQLAARESARRSADVRTSPESGRSSDPQTESLIQTAPPSRAGHGLSGLINIHFHFGSDRV